MRAIILCISTTLVFSATVAWSQNLRVDGKLISEAPTGAPLEVASTGKVANLNADLLDGLDASSFAAAADLQAILQSFFHEVHFTGEGEFVVPRGVTRLEVTVIGGGGGGGGGFDESGGGTGWVGGGGGGGSGFVVVTVLDVLESEHLSITVGEGGVGGVWTDPGATSGANGETSTLASLDRPWRVVAAGGKGGTWANGGGKGGDGWFGGGGGAHGGAGGMGVMGNGAGSGGYVGGGGACGGAGGSGCFSAEAGGGGGGGPGGGAGGGYDGAAYPPARPGAQPGAGGGGACSGDYNSPGGDGAPGTVVIRWVGLSGRL